MLLLIENVLSVDEVRQFREHLANAEWHDGVKTAGSLARKVKNNQQLDDSSETAVSLGNFIIKRLAQHPRFIAGALPERIYPPKFNRYSDGGNYGAHVDNAIMQLPGASLRSDVSATLFLSNPDEYEGGELVVHDTYGVHQVKLPAGHLVLYPSSSLHQVMPVTRGARVASFFWVQSMVRDAAQRALLFDLDVSIQRLTRDVPEHPTLVQLSGVYHNLLRSWAGN
jgi:PKHD-type hydroxylase